jgi:hypothetical protein
LLKQVVICDTWSQGFPNVLTRHLQCDRSLVNDLNLGLQTIVKQAIDAFVTLDVVLFYSGITSGN